MQQPPPYLAEALQPSHYSLCPSVPVFQPLQEERAVMSWRGKLLLMGTADGDHQGQTTTKVKLPKEPRTRQMWMIRRPAVCLHGDVAVSNGYGCGAWGRGRGQGRGQHSKAIFRRLIND